MGRTKTPHPRPLGLDNPGTARLNNSAPHVGVQGEMDFDIRLATLTSQNFTGPQNTTKQNHRYHMALPPRNISLAQNKTHNTTLARNSGALHTRMENGTNASGVIAALLGLAPARTALRPAPLRAALGRPLGLPLAALLRGGLPARGTSLRRHGSNDWELRVRDNCFELRKGGTIQWQRQTCRHDPTTQRTKPQNPHARART